MAKQKRWCITTGVHPDFAMYLTYSPAKGGYHWTWRDVVKRNLRNNTKEHPFLFARKRDAQRIIKKNKLPTRCTIIEWME